MTGGLDLGHTFADAGLLQTALTHASYAREHEGVEDNERLEFLGDAVLGLRVSERLSTAFPQSREGELTRVRAAIVSAAHLAEVARRLNLGAQLRVSAVEEQVGGRDKSRLLANAVEAVIAAIHLDGGYAAACAFIDRQVVGDDIARFAGAATARFARKSALQEWAHARRFPTPKYRLVSAEGPDHAKTFTVAVTVGAVTAEGSGATRKEAEQAAAGKALAELGGGEAGL